MSILRCASNPAEMKTICGRKASRAGHQCFATASRRASPANAFRHDARWCPSRLAVVGIEPALERRQHQHALVTGKDVLAAVAVMRIEVDQGHSLHGEFRECMGDADSGVVEEAESHPRTAGGVMSGGPDIAECGRSVACATSSAARTAAPAAATPRQGCAGSSAYRDRYANNPRSGRRQRARRHRGSCARARPGLALPPTPRTTA